MKKHTMNGEIASKSFGIDAKAMTGTQSKINAKLIDIISVLRFDTTMKIINAIRLKAPEITIGSKNSKMSRIPMYNRTGNGNEPA